MTTEAGKTIADPRVLAVARCIGNFTVDEEVTADFLAYATEAIEAADAVDPLRRPGHIMEIRPTSYGLQHPPECRPNLLGCLVEKAASELSPAPGPPGRYEVELTGGVLRFGERIGE